MKKILQILLLTFVITSCSTDDDSSKKYPQQQNITFFVASTDNSRLSNIEFEIMNSEVEVSHSSYSNVHLPLTKHYLNHKIKEFTILEITYIDNSGGAVGVPFEPYTVTLIINLGSEVIAEKEFTVTESGHVDFVNYSFD